MAGSRGVGRRAGTRSPLAALLLGVILTGLCSGLLLTPAGADAAAMHAATRALEEDPESTTSDPLEPELVIATDAAVLEPTQTDINIHVLVRNPGADPLPAGRVTVSLGERVTNAADLTAPPASVDAGPIAEIAVAETPADAFQSLSLTVSADDWPLTQTDAPGVFRLQGEFRIEGEESEAVDPLDPALEPPLTTATAPLVWRGAGTGAQVALGTIVPLVFSEDILSMPSRTQLSEAIPQLEAALTYAGERGSTLAIDPRVIASIRAAGLDAPEGATEFLERLETSPLPSFLLQFADADPAAQASLGLEALLEPTSLAYVTRSGDFRIPDPGMDGEEDQPADDIAQPDTAQPDTEAPETGTDTDVSAEDVDTGDETDQGDDGETDAEPSEPALEELIDWPQGLPGAWPAEGNVNSATLQLLEQAEISTAVLDSSNVSAAGGPRVQLGSGSALITDHALGSALRTALSSETPAEAALGRTQFTAEIVGRATPETPQLLLGIDRDWATFGSDAWELIDELTSAPWLTPVGTDDLATGTATLLQSEGGNPQRIDLLREALNREPDVLATGALLTHPEYLDGYQRARLLELLSTPYAHDERAFAAAATNFAARDAELMRGVRAIDTQHTQLVGASTRVPVQIQNALPFEVRLTVRVVPTSAVLSVSETLYPDLVIGARSNETLLVPVHSRISSGDSFLHVTITDLDEEFEAYTGDIEISVSTHVEVIALSVLGIAGALLFGFGILRSVRRRRHAGTGTAIEVPPEA